ncbi:MAG: c-type cytochrome [Syntrophales bacterium]
MKKNRSVWPMLGIMLAIGSSLLLFGCGGGSGGGDGATSSVNGMITGTAVKGPVNGATVTAFAINNGVMGAQIGNGATDAQGNFTLSIGTYSGPVMLRMSGGTYTDEATGATVTMQPGDIMTSVMPQAIAGSVMAGVQITPLTSMAQARAQAMSGGMSAANITAANTMMGNYFSVSDILYTRPMNPLTAGSGTGATQDMRNYGMVLAAMSKYAPTIGMPFSSGMVTAMMDDAADGVLNGMMGSTQIMTGGMGGMMGNSPLPANAGTSGLANAMTGFMTSAMNRSGLTVADMQALMNKMNGGTAGGTGSGVFGSNGERIYFTAASERGTAITYTVDPASRSGSMMGGKLACVSCHGADGRGGKHSMGMMQVMDAKDIRWSVLQPEFDAEKFRLAVVNGQDPDGTQLNPDMPRWNISDSDLADLIAFLKTLP